MSKFSRFYVFFAFLLFLGSNSYAAIFSNGVQSTPPQQQIQSNQGSNQNSVNVAGYVQPQFATRDNLNSLINQQQQKFEQQAQLQIEEHTRITRRGAGVNSTGILIDEMDFNRWLNTSVERRNAVARYQNYLATQLGSYNVPPMQQLLTTARSWADCGYEPYQLPPEYLWPNMINTLRLYAVLKQQGILPPTTQIRSVYRSPDLNDCAGGASNSKHMSNGAIDIWVPEYDGNEWQINLMQNNLCDFWHYQGQDYDFGLGLYSTGSIHLDTQGYRKWGSSHSSASSPCRF